MSIILKIEPTGYPNGLNVRQERKRNQKQSFGLSNWGIELTITKMKAEDEADCRRIGV